jgi:hypothetical protein
VKLHEVEGAGHWVPLSHERQLLDLMLAALPELQAEP